MSKPTVMSHWFHWFEQVHGAVAIRHLNELYAYLAYPAVAVHPLFAGSIHQQLVYPKAIYSVGYCHRVIFPLTRALYYIYIDYGHSSRKSKYDRSMAFKSGCTHKTAILPPAHEHGVVALPFAYYFTRDSICKL
jgi:hypothetical protein